MYDFMSKRSIEKNLRANGFGSGTAKKIVSLVWKAIEEEKGKEPMREMKANVSEKA